MGKLLSAALAVLLIACAPVPVLALEPIAEYGVYGIQLDEDISTSSGFEFGLRLVW